MTEKERAILDVEFFRLNLGDKFVFGKQFLPTPTELLKQTITGVLDPIGAQRETALAIKKHNEMVMERAESLAFASALGIKLPPRVVVSGSGASVSKAVPIITPLPTGFTLPEWFVFTPTPLDMTPAIAGWSREHLFHYVKSGDYSKYLQQNGASIPELAQIQREIFLQSIKKERNPKVGQKARLTPFQQQFHQFGRSLGHRHHQRLTMSP